MYVGSKGTPGRMSFITLSPTPMDANEIILTSEKNVFEDIKVKLPHLAASLSMAQACCWTHSRASRWQRNKTLTSRETSALISFQLNVTYKLSIMGVEVHGLCVSFSRGMDFIRWYIGGHAMRACSVWVFRVRDNSRWTFKNRFQVKRNKRGEKGSVKGYSVDVAPVPFVDESSRLQRHWFMYQLHIFNKFWGFKHIQCVKKDATQSLLKAIHTCLTQVNPFQNTNVPSYIPAACDSTTRG